MREPDSLEDLLREEWKAPEPSAELDESVTSAYGSAVQRESPWRVFWTMRISIPAPALLVAAVAIVALVVWLRPAAAPPVPAQSPGVVTQLNASGFQPLPNGEARVVPAVEIVK